MQAEKLETEYEMIEWHYQFNAHELTVENDEGQGPTKSAWLGWPHSLLLVLFCSPHPHTSVSAAPSVEGMKGIHDPPGSSTHSARLFSQSDLSTLF